MTLEPSLTAPALRPAEIDSRLKTYAKLRFFQAGEEIFLQDEPVEAIYWIVSGRVKIVRHTVEGNELILCQRGPGDYFCYIPLLQNGVHLGTAYALTKVALYQIHRNEFAVLCQKHPAIQFQAMQACLREIPRLIARLEEASFHSIHERLASALLDSATHQASNSVLTDRVELHFTQQDLAELIGSTRESVSRSLQRFRQEGILTLARGRVVICDLAKLESVANPQTWPRNLR